MIVEIFSDGACLGNPGPGGWAFLIKAGKHQHEASGAEKHTTNNRMEMLAIIQAFKALKKTAKVQVYTDSQYVKNGITLWVKAWVKNKWLNSQKKPVKNKDLWEMLLEVTKEHQVEWFWVKGHAGHKENEYVDSKAQEAVQALIKRISV